MSRTREAAHGLADEHGALHIAARHDALFLDLDGVIYRGDRVIEGVPGVLRRLRGTGSKLLFITNNSSKTPEQVAAKLADMGIEARPEEVLTSALATASMLHREGYEGKDAFVVGERGIVEALRAVGIRVLDESVEDSVGGPVDLVVVGWDRSVDYDKLRTASLLVERGARLVATNPDTSYPAADGLWPGAGAILAAVTATTGATPTIVGKPARPMFESAIEHTAARNPLVVGDRLDTDVAGATAMGLDSLLVLSGASRPSDLLGGHPAPTYIGDNVSVLLEDAPPARFRAASPQSVDAISTLLERSGLSATGVEKRLAETLVCPWPSRTGPTQATPNRAGAVGNAASDTEAIAAIVCVEQVGGFGLLRSLAVRKDVRGKGLGILAVAAGVRMARQRGLRAVALLTETAAPFFEALGFRSVLRSELPRVIATSPQAAEECAESATAMLLEL